MMLEIKNNMCYSRDVIREAWTDTGGVIMDIAGLSMSMASNNLQTKVGTAVLSKAMDTNEALGQGLVQMIDSAAMERSVTPELGANIDLRL